MFCVFTTYHHMEYAFLLFYLITHSICGYNLRRYASGLWIVCIESVRPHILMLPPLNTHIIYTYSGKNLIWLVFVQGYFYYFFLFIITKQIYSCQLNKYEMYFVTNYQMSLKFFYPGNNHPDWEQLG